MPKLQDILEIPKDAVELLEAVGYLDVEDLPGADTEELLDELVKANTQLAIMPENPTEEIVEEWKNVASVLTADPRENKQEYEQVTPAEEEAPRAIEEGVSDGADTENAGNGEGADTGAENAAEEDAEDEDAHLFDVDPAVVNFEDDPEVREMLLNAPEAEPLHPSLIRRHKLAVDDIPEGVLLTHCTGEVEINVMTTPRMANAQRRDADAKRTGLMVSRIRDFEQAGNGGHHVKPLDRGKSKESVSVSEGLNAGLRPDSRRFVRGVLHPYPVSVRVSAFFAVLVQLFLAANLIGIPWLLIHEFLSGESMLWWVVGLAGGLVLSALCYLFWGMSARCRVCGQRQFAPKKCLKNKKAHHIPLIGYIFPTALHAMFFKWFYCTYCGTAVRLKK